MKISVITATWNSESTILDAIQSMRDQTYSDIEYIVIDGGSTDSTMDIIGQNKDIVDYVISERDAGIYDALNKGIAAASGDVLGFLHSDDIFAHRDVLLSVATTFSKKKSDSVYGDLNYVSKDDTSKIVRKWRSGAFCRENMCNGWMPPHPTFYMKRALYQEYGVFDLNFRIAADYDSILRYLWKHGVTTAYIPKVLINMRVGGESNRSLKNILNKTKEDVQAMKLNDLPIIRAILGKNFSKIPQFFIR